MPADAASTGGRGPGERPFPDRPEGTDTLPQIDHFLVLMMENHSYDNYLGMLGRGAGEQPRGDGFTIGPDAPADGGKSHLGRRYSACISDADDLPVVG